MIGPVDGWMGVMFGTRGDAGQGFGTESENNYANCELIYLNIHNIHVMRDRCPSPPTQHHFNRASLKKLKDICFGAIDDGRWFSDLEATHWLRHVKVGTLNVLRACHVSTAGVGWGGADGGCGAEGHVGGGALQ